MTTAAKQKESLAHRVAVVIREHTQKAYTPLRERIAALEQRCAMLEAGHVSNLTFADLHRGVWSSDANYLRGQLVTDRGSVWLALSETPRGPAPPLLGGSW